MTSPRAHGLATAGPKNHIHAGSGTTPPPAACQGENANAVVEYIADMALSLRDMAAEARQPFLGYLLEMVFQEAHCEALRLRFTSNKQTIHQA